MEKQTKYEDIFYVEKEEDIIEPETFLKDADITIEELIEKMDKLRLYISVNAEDAEVVSRSTRRWTDLMSDISLIRREYNKFKECVVRVNRDIQNRIESNLDDNEEEGEEIQTEKQPHDENLTGILFSEENK